MCKHLLIQDFQLSDLQTVKEFASRTNENDGYGAIIRTTANSIETLKSLCLASFYIELTKRVSLGDVSTLVVHHRTSTNEPGIQAAHPFEFEDNYLTHNGVVSVPGTHKTNTTNDSEALLHHLIKTNYNTADIQGYFSCFIINPTETIVLVDATAPIYTTDNRVYSSHRLLETDNKIELAKITHNPLTGEMLAWDLIEVTKSTYGHSQASKSLGYDLSYTTLDYAPHDNDMPIVTDNVRDFFDLIQHSERQEYWRKSERDAYEYIQDVSYSMGLDLTHHEVMTVMDILDQYAA